MSIKIPCILLCFLGCNVFGQTHFTTFKTPTYKTVQIQSGSSIDDNMKFDVIDFNQIKELKGLAVHLKQLTDDSSQILIYRNKKLIQAITIPIMFWHIDNECQIADLDNNKKPDIKLIIYSGGSGLAAEYATKIYLFNYETKFSLLSFFDFSHEKEYDLNTDGKYEILSCNHVQKDGHSYWVYNAYNFSQGKLKNISKGLQYPLWTRHLYKSRNKIATNISQKDREKEFRILPDETIIK